MLIYAPLQFAGYAGIKHRVSLVSENVNTVLLWHFTIADAIERTESDVRIA